MAMTSVYYNLYLHQPPRAKAKRTEIKKQEKKKQSQYKPDSTMRKKAVAAARM